MSYVLGSQKEITIYTQNKTKFQKEKRHYGIVAADHISPDICRAVFMSNYGTEQA